MALTWMQVVPMERKKCIYDEAMVNVNDGKSDLILFLFIDTASRSHVMS